MRTTLDLPDELFREAKVYCAIKGIALKDLFIQALRDALPPSENLSIMASGQSESKRGEAGPESEKPGPALSGDPFTDEFLAKAGEQARLQHQENARISVAFFQRRLTLGYNQALNLVNHLVGIGLLAQSEETNRYNYIGKD